MALLRTRGLHVQFGGVCALDSIDLDLDEGTVTGLIGPNGSGKTTFLDAVSGAVPLTGGRVEFRGADVTDLSMPERAHRGLVRTFQTLELFEDLTVEENLAAAAETTPWWQFLTDALRPRRSAPAAERVHHAIDLVGLGDLRHRTPAELSHGQRRLVGVARALATSPTLLMLDEPAAGLDSAETAALGRRLRRIAEHGVTMLLIDHDMDLVLDVCEMVHVLDFGTIVASGHPDQVRTDPAVIEAYLGTNGSRRRPG